MRTEGAGLGGWRVLETLVSGTSVLRSGDVSSLPPRTPGDFLMWQWTHGTVESAQNRLGGVPASGLSGAAVAQVEAADMLDSL